MDRFNCDGLVKISINIDTCIAKVHLKHNILHKRPEWFGVTEVIKESSGIYAFLPLESLKLSKYVTKPSRANALKVLRENPQYIHP